MTFLLEIARSARDLRAFDFALTRTLRHEKNKDTRIAVLIERARLRLRLHQLNSAWADIRTLQEMDVGRKCALELLELEADYHLAIFEVSSVGFANRHALRQATEIYKSILNSDFSNKATSWVHYQLGRCYMLLMDYSLAVQEFQQALVLPGSRYHSELTAYCYERLGYIEYYEYRNPSVALLYLERSLITYPTGADELWRVSVYLLCGRILREYRHIEEALSATRTALEIAAQNDGTSLIAESLLAISELLAMTTGNDREIINVITQYMHFKKRPLGVDLTWGTLSDMLGDAYFNLWQYDNAIEAYQDAFYFNPDHVSEAHIQLKMARCYYQLRKYKSAEDCVLRALNSTRRENYDHAESYLYELLGNTYFSMHEYQAALNAYENVLKAGTVATNLHLQGYVTIARNNVTNGMMYE